MIVHAQPATDRDAVAAKGAVTLMTVPAAWPAGVSALALAVNACQRRDVQVDWPLEPPKKIVSPSAYCD